MDFENLKPGMKLYLYNYGYMSYYDKAIGYSIYEVQEIKENVVVLKKQDTGQCFEVNKDDFYEYEEYTDELLPQIKETIEYDYESIGYEDAMFSYEKYNIHQLRGVLKAVIKLIKNAKGGK